MTNRVAMASKFIFCVFMVYIAASVSSAQPALKSHYDCELIIGKGAVYRDGYATNCKYNTQKNMTFLWAGTEKTIVNFENIRAITNDEYGYAQYWLNNISKLDDSTMMHDKFALTSILTNAASSGRAYAMDTTRGGKEATVLVYVSGEGIHFGMSYPKSLPRHEPYDLWYTK